MRLLCYECVAQDEECHGKSLSIKSYSPCLQATFILGFTVLVMFTWWLAHHIYAYYIFVRYGFQWFEESLPSASEVAGDLHALLKLSPYFL